MKIVRVYSGDDGESHFEDVSPEEMVEVAKRLGEGDIQLNARPAPVSYTHLTLPTILLV